MAYFRCGTSRKLSTVERVAATSTGSAISYAPTEDCYIVATAMTIGCWYDHDNMRYNRALIQATISYGREFDEADSGIVNLTRKLESAGESEVYGSMAQCSWGGFIGGNDGDVTVNTYNEKCTRFGSRAEIWKIA